MEMSIGLRMISAWHFAMIRNVADYKILIVNSLQVVDSQMSKFIQAYNIT